jgi:glutamate-5-semialdehyde dehydrogenase
MYTQVIGSNQLVKYVQQNTSIPVIGHADGICSVYLDNQASHEVAVKVVVDGKVFRSLT